MNSHTAPTPAPVGPPFPLATRPARRRFGWRHIFLLFALVGVSGVLLLVASFRMGGEARQLSRAIHGLAPDTYQRQIEIGAGRLPLLLVRAGLRCLRLEPEARAALSAIRSADVGVYRRRSTADTLEPQHLDQSIQSLMQDRGWIPLVRVKDGSEQVAVFVTESRNLLGEMPVCVVVANASELVLVSARITPEPLIDALSDRCREDWDRLGLPDFSKVTPFSEARFVRAIPAR